jgi:hypothetical protein
MRTNSLSKKGLVVGIIMLLGINIAPFTNGLLLEKDFVKEKLNLGPLSDIQGINVTITGTMGENDWYVSNVVITLTADNGSCNGSVYYKLHPDDLWTLWPNAPLSISIDGIYELWVACIDSEGQWHVYGPFPFKIDKTAPTFINLTEEKTGHNKYRIHADVFDATSGVNKVEFYQNCCLMHTDDTAPYEWLYRGPSFKLDAIVYDKAGNSAMPMTSPDLNSYFAIGFIENPQIEINYGATFYARFVIVFEHYFPFLYHVSTLINQQFAVPPYTGNINEHFIIIKYHGGY